MNPFAHAFNDTIAAISTPLGAGGIGIIRLSGKDALAVADRIFVAKDGQKPSAFRTYTLHYGWIIKSRQAAGAPAARASKRKLNKKGWKGNIIDEALLSLMRAPRSYTKEDIVEINCHSGIVVLREILDLVLSRGARLAEPGEFTKRAFLNGRIDLDKAEAVLDVINAKTRLALESGIRQLSGGLSDEINRIKDMLLDITAELEAAIDFPEEEIEGVDKIKTEKILLNAARAINNLLDSFSHGRILQEGISAVILGRPNAGKSSLLNALLKEERAIVSPVAGTTRDAIEEIIDIRGIPLKIADTAGIIEPKDLIEREAVKRTQLYFQKAGLILLVFDASRPLSKEDKELIAKASHKKVIAILNKCDLKVKIEEAIIKKHFGSVVRISSLKLKGLKGLEKSIISLIWGGEIENQEELMVTNSRHIQALESGLKALTQSLNSLKEGLSIELIAEDIKVCRSHLGCITGETAREDILDKIFSRFCVGK